MQTIIYRMDTQQGPTVYLMLNCNGKEHEERIYIYICITESLFCTEEINMTV